MLKHGLPLKLPVEDVAYMTPTKKWGYALTRKSSIVKMSDGQIRDYLLGVEAEMLEGVKPGETPRIMRGVIEEARRRRIVL